MRFDVCRERLVWALVFEVFFFFFLVRCFASMCFFGTGFVPLVFLADVRLDLVAFFRFFLLGIFAV